MMKPSNGELPEFLDILSDKLCRFPSDARGAVVLAHAIPARDPVSMQVADQLRQKTSLQISAKIWPSVHLSQTPELQFVTEGVTRSAFPRDQTRGSVEAY
jgi:hypothetical protein